MDRETEFDRLMDRASTAALESLNAKVDVQQRLQQLLERADVKPEQPYTEQIHSR